MFTLPSPKLAFTLAAFSFGLMACATDYGPGVYSTEEVGRVQYVDYGTVEAVRHVKIKRGEPGVGTVAGAVVGGAVGSQIGEGDAARVVGVVGGAIVGGAIGKAIEEDVNTRDGYEYTIRMENGDIVTIVQEADGPPIPAGSRVRILDGHRVRVVSDNGYYR